MSNQFLDAAIEYASKGLAVFPVKAKGKNPLTNNGVKDATTNFDQIEKWWKRYPSANIGIACGEVSGGLLVVDLDEKDNGISGADSLNQWERENGQLPDSWRSLTGSGGVHIFYKLDGTTKNRVNLLDGVDIRSDGGYIVAPPSVHPNGHRYEWEYGPDDLEIAEADDTVKELLGVGKQADPERFVLPESIGKGQRNDTIYKMACSMQAKGALDDVIYIACKAVNEKQCDPPMSDEEVEKIVESALTKAKGIAKALAPSKELDLLMVTDAKGNEKVRQCAENVTRVILNDSKLAGKIKDDRFGYRLMYLGQLDWREKGDVYGEWTDKDDSALQSYLDIKYNLRNDKDYTNGFNVALLDNSYDPLVGYLDALEWDGIHRIDEAMTKCLGVEPTRYNVAAFRTFLLGAVRRAYNPGCKFDYMLVFVGQQGDGKSTFCKLLACNDEWYDENFNFKDTNSKATIENMAGKWILEMGEMDTMKRDFVTADALKAFITTQSDSYRAPYGRRAERRPRHCVFCGTSNDKNFLKDRTGNRRYLPIDCHSTAETKRFMFEDQENVARPYLRQVVAEMVAYYKAHPNEQAVLPEDIAGLAAEAQNNHLEEDVWVSIIDDFLRSEPCNRVNAAYLWDKAFDRDVADMRKGEVTRILTIMRNEIEGWHEIGKARMNGYGRAGICFERDPISVTYDVKSDTLEGDTDAIGDTLEGFEDVTGECDILF